MRLLALLAELKRRKVFRVAAVYAATAFVVLQAADLVLPALLLPEWTYRLLVLLVLFGSPIALVLAWAFDITAAGVRRTEPQSGQVASPEEAEPLPALLGRRTALVSGALVVLGVGLGAGWFLKPAAVAAPDFDTPAAPAIADKSVAVLPFADLSESGDQEWFAEGLAEEILTSLARLPELRVIGRNSSFLFSSGTADDRVIADTLGVAHLVKGSVRRAGDRFRVSAQLVRAADGVQLWSESYDRLAEDLLDVQRDVAEKVAAALDVLLDDHRRERMFAAGTRDVPAFEAFLRGMQIYRAVHAGDSTWTLADANDWFGRAFELDSGFARAALMHSDRYAHLLMDGPEHPWVGPHGLSQEEALARLRRDKDRAARTAAPGYARIVAELNRELFGSSWRRMPWLVEELRKVSHTQEPSLEDLWVDMVLHVMGDLDLARELSGRLVRADPLEPVAWSYLAGVELSEGRLEAARALIRQARETAGDHRFIDDAEIASYLIGGDRDGIERFLERTPGFDAIRAALRGDWAAVQSRALASEEALGAPPANLLVAFHLLGDRQASRDLVRRIDALPAGPVVLARELWFHGRTLTFDPADAPNFSARLAEAGVDPGSFPVMLRLSGHGGAQP